MPATEREILRARAEAIFGRPDSDPIRLGPVSRKNPKAEWHNSGIVFDAYNRGVRVERRNRARKLATVH